MFLFSGKVAAVWRLRGRRDDFSRPPPVWFLFLFKVEFWNVCFCAWRNAFGSWANPRSLHPARCGRSAAPRPGSGDPFSVFDFRFSSWRVRFRVGCGRWARAAGGASVFVSFGLNILADFRCIFVISCRVPEAWSSFLGTPVSPRCDERRIRERRLWLLMRQRGEGGGSYYLLKSSSLLSNSS